MTSRKSYFRGRWVELVQHVNEKDRYRQEAEKEDRMISLEDCIAMSGLMKTR